MFGTYECKGKLSRRCRSMSPNNKENFMSLIHKLSNLKKSILVYVTLSIV